MSKALSNRKRMQECGQDTSHAGWRCTPLMPSTWEAEAVRALEFEASLVFKISSRTGSVATQRNAVSRGKKKMREREAHHMAGAL